MVNRFTGTGVAVVTPFKKSGTLDLKALEKVLNHIIDGGVEFLVALGTTAESPTLSKEEKSAVVNTFRETVSGRIPIMLGIGGNNTQEVINTIHATGFEGIDAVLSVAPYYNKPGQQGIYEHFKAISGSCPVPVYLYNVPSRTGSGISAETTLRLAKDCGNVAGIKEASGDFSQIMKIIGHKPGDFVVLSGDDAITLPLISVGVEGVISVVANAFPKEFSDMVRFARSGNFKKAAELHYDLLEIIEYLFRDGSPGGIKAILEKMGLCGNNLRLPLVKVNRKVSGHLSHLIKK